MSKFEFHEYTASSLQDPDLAGYGRAGWELVAVLPYEKRYTFFLQREYVMRDGIKSEPREWFIAPPDDNEFVKVYKGGSGESLHGYIKVREVLFTEDELTERNET